MQRLNLEGTRISDTGLNSLKVLTNLKELDVGHTRVTDQGKKNFRRELPDCKVTDW